jgi:hypothetical protein
MSLQRVTPFYWGEDRLASFIPFILSPITQPNLNLIAHLFIFSLSFFFFLFLCARLIVKLAGDRDSNTSILTAFGILLVASLLVLTPLASYAFILEGQPYALSYSFLIVAFLRCLCKSESLRLNWALVSFTMFIGMGLNPSILVPAAALTCGHVLVAKTSKSLFFFGIAFVVFLVWAKLAKWWGVPSASGAYSSFDFQDPTANVSEAISSVLGGINLAALVLVAIGLGVLGLLRGVRQADPSRNILAMMWLFAAIWLLVFSQNKWIKLNHNHFRYFFPVFVTLIFQLGYALYSHVRHLRESSQRLIAGACFVGAIWFLARPVVPLGQYAALSRVKPYADFAIGSGSRFVSGDYWEVWPSVFELLNLRGDAFGLGHRAVGNRQNTLDALNSELEARGELRMLCLSSSAACSSELERFTHRKWRVNGEKQKDSCVLLVLKPEDFNPNN